MLYEMKLILKFWEAKSLMGLEVHQDGDKTTLIWYLVSYCILCHYGNFLDGTSHE